MGRRGLSPKVWRVAVTVLAVAAASGARAEPARYSVKTLSMEARIGSIRAKDSGTVVVTDAAGTRHLLTMGKDGGLRSRRLAATPVAKETRPNILPDGEVSKATRNIATAWLTGPTDRYGHGALGDDIEASGIAVELKSGGRLIRLDLTLEDDSVFEDRLARLVDMDGDGEDEVLVVRSTQDRGAALALIEADESGLRIAAQSPAHGLPYRWLNPVGVADFDGDGRPEAAIVRTPHIGGILELFEWNGGELVREQRQPGFSNHINGTRNLGLSAIRDVNGDGVADILVPDASLGSLRMVTFKGGRFTELGRIAHGRNRIQTGMALADLDGDGRTELVYGLFDGTVVAVFFSP